MKKLATLLTAVLCMGAAAAIAGEGDKHMHKNMEMNMKTMDANGDGMISKDEFMRHHEKMWDQMKKNSSGMVDMKEMHSMHSTMMHDKMDKTNKMDKTK